MKTETKADKEARRKAEIEAAGTTEAATTGPVAPRGEVLDGGDVDEVIKLDKDEAVEVVYMGCKETKGTKPGEINRLHKLMMADGVARGLWGTVQLDAMLAKTTNGDSLWICYLGKTDLPGNKTLHNWKVVRTARAGRV